MLIVKRVAVTMIAVAPSLAGQAGGLYAATAVTNGSNPNLHDVAFGTEYTSFTTGNTAATLNTVTVRCDLIHSAPSGGVSLAASIRADDAGHPSATVLETLPTFAPPIDINGNVTFASTGLLLAPDTTYWVRLSPSGSASPHWRVTDSFAETSPYGWTIGDGSQIPSGSPGAWLTHTYTGFLSIDATLLPEPSLPLAACALLASPALTRRPRRRPHLAK